MLQLLLELSDQRLLFTLFDLLHLFLEQFCLVEQVALFLLKCQFIIVSCWVLFGFEWCLLLNGGLECAERLIEDLGVLNYLVVALVVVVGDHCF